MRSGSRVWPPVRAPLNSSSSNSIECDVREHEAPRSRAVLKSPHWLLPPLDPAHDALSCALCPLFAAAFLCFTRLALCAAQSSVSLALALALLPPRSIQPRSTRTYQLQDWRR